MERELRDLVNLTATLEQTASGFVPQIMEAGTRNVLQAAGLYSE